MTRYVNASQSVHNGSTTVTGTASPHEQVQVWLRQPGSNTTSAVTLTADHTGKFAYTLPHGAHLPNGDPVVVAKNTDPAGDSPGGTPFWEAPKTNQPVWMGNAPKVDNQSIRPTSSGDQTTDNVHQSPSDLKQPVWDYSHLKAPANRSDEWGSGTGKNPHDQYYYRNDSGNTYRYNGDGTFTRTGGGGRDNQGSPEKPVGFERTEDGKTAPVNVYGERYTAPQDMRLPAGQKYYHVPGTDYWTPMAADGSKMLIHGKGKSPTYVDGSGKPITEAQYRKALARSSTSNTADAGDTSMPKVNYPEGTPQDVKDTTDRTMAAIWKALGGGKTPAGGKNQGAPTGAHTTPNGQGQTTTDATTTKANLEKARTYMTDVESKVQAILSSAAANQEVYKQTVVKLIADLNADLRDLPLDTATGQETLRTRINKTLADAQTSVQDAITAADKAKRDMTDRDKAQPGKKTPGKTDNNGGGDNTDNNAADNSKNNDPTGTSADDNNGGNGTGNNNGGNGTGNNNGGNGTGNNNGGNGTGNNNGGNGTGNNGNIQTVPTNTNNPYGTNTNNPYGTNMNNPFGNLMGTNPLSTLGNSLGNLGNLGNTTTPNTTTPNTTTPPATTTPPTTTTPVTTTPTTTTPPADTTTPVTTTPNPDHTDNNDKSPTDPDNTNSDDKHKNAPTGDPNKTDPAKTDHDNTGDPNKHDATPQAHDKPDPKNLTVKLPDGKTYDAPNADAAAAARHALDDKSGAGDAARAAYAGTGVTLPTDGKDWGAPVEDPSDLKVGDVVDCGDRTYLVVGPGLVADHGEVKNIADILSGNNGEDFKGFFRPTEAAPDDTGDNSSSTDKPADPAHKPDHTGGSGNDPAHKATGGDRTQNPNLSTNPVTYQPTPWQRRRAGLTEV